ncbi:hypothetical protein P879_05035 [Paragonimus westermani]|uniref:Uncharacterized protein n=1 Tax=Paragonimus westermani TaxID=34504 RepID=A0A8T0DF64_9TREM|nr:hypothetical protein P879_05035 [Paragonimus westermani]
MLVYQALVRTTTGYTPACLRFGHEPRLSLELSSPIPPSEAPSMPDCVRNLCENLRITLTSAQYHMKDAQRRQKKQHGQDTSRPGYVPGCRVWLHRLKTGLVSLRSFTSVPQSGFRALTNGMRHSRSQKPRLMC